MKQFALAGLLFVAILLASCRAASPLAAPASTLAPPTDASRTAAITPLPIAPAERLGPLPAPVTDASPLPAATAAAPPSPSVVTPANPQPAPAPETGSGTSPAPGGLAPVAWRHGGAKTSEGAQFSELGGLAAGEDVLYVADAYNGVLMFDLAGEYLGLISAGEVGYITDVKAGRSGDVYIADSALHQITRFNADHDLMGGFGVYGPGDGEFGSNGPAALAVGAEGEVFALDPNVDDSGKPVMRVHVFSGEGEYLRSFPAEPDLDAVGMVAGPDGTLLIVSRQGYVAEVEPEAGRLIQRMGQEALAGAWPQMIDVDDAGNLYVTTHVPAAVFVLGANGHRLVETIGVEGVRTDEGWGAGELLMPRGIAVSRNAGRVFVADTVAPFAYVTAFERD